MFLSTIPLLHGEKKQKNISELEKKLKLEDEVFRATRLETKTCARKTIWIG